jgi:opacity protein-like surface antigen
MKKVILFAAFAVVAFATQAQVKFGAKAGMNLANLSGDISDNKMKVGFNVGGLVNIPVSENLSVQPEILYSAEGTKFGGSSTVDLNLGYVNIPVMLKYSSTGFYGEVGPQLGILASAKYKSGSSSASAKDDINSTNFGVAFGAGYELSSGLGFGARYSLGLSNIAKDAGGDKVKTSNISVGVHYIFGGAKSSKD